MRKAERFVLFALVSGVFLSGVGGFLFIRKLMVAYTLDWEIQMIIAGLFIIVVAVALAKILSKVKLDGN